MRCRASLHTGRCSDSIVVGILGFLAKEGISLRFWGSVHVVDCTETAAVLLKL